MRRPRLIDGDVDVSLQQPTVCVVTVITTVALAVQPVMMEMLRQTGKGRAQ